MISLRIVFIALALVIGYFAIYFGDGIHVFAAADLALPKDKSTGLVVFVIIGSIILTFFGGFAWFVAIAALADNEENTCDIEYVILSSAAFVLLGAVFGVIAGPFSNYGPYPWYWASMLDVLLLIALVPMVMAVHGLVIEIIADARARKEALNKNTVTPIRRDRA